MCMLTTLVMMVDPCFEGIFDCGRQHTVFRSFEVCIVAHCVSIFRGVYCCMKKLFIQNIAVFKNFKIV